MGTLNNSAQRTTAAAWRELAWLVVVLFTATLSPSTMATGEETFSVSYA